jgi:hypothetical protein
MKRWRATWVLFSLALLLFAFIMLVERRYWPPTRSRGEIPPALFSFKATEVTNIQLRITNQLILRVERPADAVLWRLALPLSYPGQLHRIEGTLQELEHAVSEAYIPPAELRANKRNAAEFGLDLPQATLTLLHNGHRTEISFGNKSPTGDKVYVQVANKPGIYVLGADVFNHLPRSANDWRDTSLFNLIDIAFNRIELRAGSRSFAVDLDQSTKTFVLSKPTPARADAAKVELLVRNLLAAQIRKFITDNPRADGEPYGLQPPEVEVSFAKGTNDQLVVQFGKSPTNDPSLVYARRMTQTNIVLVPRSILESLPASHNDLRDRRLVTFNPAAADAIEVISTNSFTVRRGTNGMWSVGDAQPMAADPELMTDWLNQLASLEGTVESDVVTDFKTLYNLSPPARQYLLKAAITNGGGSVSNGIVAELDLGAVQGDKVFARRPDEQSVYSLPLANVTRLPAAAWQLRNRRVWTFSSNQLSRLIVMYRGMNEVGRTNILQRSPNNQWTIVSGSNVIINNPEGFSSALDELMSRLGELRAEAWIAQGEESRATYGFDAPGSRVTFELKNSDKPRLLTLEFGAPSPSGLPYALATAEGQTWIFEFPRAPYWFLIRDLFSPLFRESQ